MTQAVVVLLSFSHYLSPSSPRGNDAPASAITRPDNDRARTLLQDALRDHQQGEKQRAKYRFEQTRQGDYSGNQLMQWHLLEARLLNSDGKFPDTIERITCFLQQTDPSLQRIDEAPGNKFFQAHAPGSATLHSLGGLPSNCNFTHPDFRAFMYEASLALINTGEQGQAKQVLGELVQYAGKEAQEQQRYSQELARLEGEMGLTTTQHPLHTTNQDNPPLHQTLGQQGHAGLAWGRVDDYATPDPRAGSMALAEVSVGNTLLPSSAQDHRTMGNERAKTYQCSDPQCNYATDYKANLKQHMNIHLGNKRVKPHKCNYPQCNYATDRRDSLKQHMNTHLGNKRAKPHKCSHPQCNYATDQKGSLKQHMIIHRGNKRAKPHKCSESQCNYATDHKGDLKRHMNTHLGNKRAKPHKCSDPQCNYATDRKSSLKQHMLRGIH